VTLRNHLGTPARRRALVALGGLALAALAACKSSGVERSEATQTTIAEFKTELQNYSATLDKTFASLDELIKNAKVDPKGEFAKFSANLDALIKSAENARSNSEQMKSLGDAYFLEWEKAAATITNEDIRKISDQRRAELQKSYKELRTTMTEVAADAKPLREQLISLREYYSQDLTEKGIGHEDAGLQREVGLFQGHQGHQDGARSGRQGRDAAQGRDPAAAPAGGREAAGEEVVPERRAPGLDEHDEHAVRIARPPKLPGPPAPRERAAGKASR